VSDWQPLQAGTLRLLAAAGVFAATLTLYGLTLAPTVTLVDSGELIVAARTLGVAHPPGFPLYTLLAHAATLLPFGSVAVRVNFASALCAAAAAAVLALLAAEALQSGAPAPRSARRSSPKRQARGSEPHADSSRRGPVIELTPVFVAAFLLACSRTLWSYATVAEVYALNTLLILVVFLCVLRWRHSFPLPPRGEGRGEGSSHPNDRWLHAAALVFGLALGVHHVTVGLTLPALAVLVYAAAGIGFFKSRRLAFATLWAVAGLSIYLYLPLAAARSPVLNWGDPRTLQRLWWHVVGRQYLVSLSLSPDTMAHQARDFLRLASREFGPWWFPAGLVLAAIGFAALRRRDRALFCCLSLVVICDLAYAFNYDIAEDKEAYYLPAVVAAALAAGCGAQRLIEWAHARLPGRRQAGALTAGALLLVPLVAFTANLPFNNRSRYFIAQDYVENILGTIEPGGMLLTLDWQVCSPMLYTRLIEERRPDVVLIDVHLLRRAWYFDYLRREYPAVLEQNRDKVEPFLEDLRQWEQDPDAYERSPSLNRRIDSRFHDMILTFASRHVTAAAVYATQDVVLSADPRNSELAKALATAYQLVPQGLVFQLLPDRAFHEPAAARLVTRGLSDGTLRFDTDDVVTLKVLPVYASMLYNRGRYLALHGRAEQAVAAFRQALAVDPGFVPAQRALAEGARGGR
jgi:hypothetical protein